MNLTIFDAVAIIRTWYAYKTQNQNQNQIKIYTVWLCYSILLIVTHLTQSKFSLWLYDCTCSSIKQIKLSKMISDLYITKRIHPFYSIYPLLKCMYEYVWI